MDQQSDAKQTAKTAILNSVANIFTLVVGMVLIPVIAKALPVDDVGVANTFISTRNISAIIMSLATYGYISRAMLDYKEDKANYLYTIVLFCIAMCVSSFLLLLPFREILKRLLSLSDFLFVWLFVSSFLFCIYMICDYYCLFHNKYKTVASIVLLNGTLAPILSLLLVLWSKNNKYIARVIGLDSAVIAVSIVFLLWIISKKHKKPKLEYISSTLRYSVPLVPHLLSQMVLTQCDLIMISYYHGPEKAGIYSMGHTVGFLALTVLSQVMSAWSPWVFRRWEEGNKTTVYDNSKLMFLFGTYLSVGLLTVSPELIKIFLPDVYLPCIYIVPPLVVAMGFQFLYIFVNDVEYYNKKTIWIAYASSMAAVCNLVLNWIFIPRLGYMAAGYTTVFSYLLLLVIGYLFARKLGINTLYDCKKIAICVLALIVYAAMMMLLSGHWIVRYIILTCITLVLVGLKYKDLVKLYIQLR